MKGFRGRVMATEQFADSYRSANFCTFINEVYEVLSDPAQRRVYDDIHGYSLTLINPFADDSTPKDHVFVNEFSCIGCKNCANFGNPDLLQQLIDSCTVDCIHWTSPAQLSLLEDEMRRIERVNLLEFEQIVLMLSGMGSTLSDVFIMSNTRWKKGS
ncbi:unnamed protein product [Vicia faba]|uniref:4Fe-4S ferredoxin-type domain-containing protein n=1 Tax=Vicia faba TaxID=3906 RepID=A0AAV1AYR8_VICFA|nr:unnamed protein product [Vicia faba]